MRHLTTLLLLIAAGIAYVAAFGPLFFGAPLLGCVLIAAAILLEINFWRRVLHRRA